MKKSQTSLAVVLLLFLGFIWGSGYALAKYALARGVPVLGYTFWQSLGPAIVLTCISFFKSKQVFSIFKYWRFGLICGLLGIVIPNTNMYLLAQHLDAGTLAILVNTVPILVYPLALVFKQEHFEPLRMLGLLLGVLGIFLVLGPIDPSFSKKAALVLLTPLSFALCSIYIAAYQPAKLTTAQTASGMLLAASFLLAPLVIQQNAFYSLTGSFTYVKLIVMVEIILSSLGYFIFFKLIKIAGPVFYSLTGAVVSLTGLLWGYLVFKEIPGLIQWIAVLFIISALIILSWRQTKYRERTFKYE